MTVANDPELLALPVRKLELGTAITKAAKDLGHETIGDLLAASPTHLAQAGLSAAALRQIADAASDLGLQWPTDGKLDEVVASDEPVSLDLPAAIVKLSRPTFVLEDWAPTNAPMSDASCTHCKNPLKLLAQIDLTAFADSQLPARTVRVGRCDFGDCTQFLPKPGMWSVILESQGGDRPRYRRENDYPDGHDLPKLPSERASETLSDHKFDTIGSVPRVGGWPSTAHGIKPWPTCTVCGEKLVLALQVPGDEIQELVFICAGACPSGGAYVLAVD